jgi:carnitine O-acetyltransferase
MRLWLNIAPPACDVRVVGLDSSVPAIQFAVDAGLLDGGIARDLESPGPALTAEEQSWFRSCNLLISTGAVGYVTDRTLGVVLDHLGKDYPGRFGPFAVLTILRMFEPTPIADAFGAHGFTFGSVPEVRLPQRRFIDDTERQQVLAVLHDRGLETAGWEDQGKQFSDLFIAAPPAQYELLYERMIATRDAHARARGMGAYIRR